MNLNMKGLSLFILLAVVQLLPHQVCCDAAGTASKPNILFIVADDLGFGDLGYTGSDIKTPNIDMMATNGTIMGHYYVMHCCSPTRSALHTGRYNIRYGLQTGVIPNTKEYGLNLTEKLLPEYMNEAGYKSHAIGKWHLGLFNWKYTPTFRGYESFFGYYGGSEDYYKHRNSGYDLHLDIGSNCGANCSHAALEFNGTYSTSLFANRAIDVISQHDARDPLFLYMPFQSVHCPIQVPPQYVEPYKNLDPNRQQFAGMLAALDEAVGEVIQSLKDKNMWENTLVVFTTDNGGPVGSENEHPAGIGCATGSQNWPLRGGKGAYYQGGVRGTSFVYGPMVHETLRGTTNYFLAHVTDWLPTLVEAAGTSPVWKNPLDGQSLWKVLTEGGSSPRKDLLINIEREDPTTAACVGCTTTPKCNGVAQYAVISGQYKLLVGGGGQPNTWYHDGLPYTGTDPTPQRGCVVACSASSPQGCPATPHVQLYDVLGDEEERHDLATSHPEIVEELMKVVERYNATEYVTALSIVTPTENKCPYNDDRGVLTPCE